MRIQHLCNKLIEATLDCCDPVVIISSDPYHVSHTSARQDDSHVPEGTSVSLHSCDIVLLE